MFYFFILLITPLILCEANVIPSVPDSTSPVQSTSSFNMLTGHLTNAAKVTSTSAAYVSNQLYAGYAKLSNSLPEKETINRGVNYFKNMFVGTAKPQEPPVATAKTPIPTSQRSQATRRRNAIISRRRRRAQHKASKYRSSSKTVNDLSVRSSQTSISSASSDTHSTKSLNDHSYITSTHEPLKNAASSVNLSQLAGLPNPQNIPNLDKSNTQPDSSHADVAIGVVKAMSSKALDSPAVPVGVKGAIVAGQSLQKAFESYRTDGDLNKALRTGVSAGTAGGTQALRGSANLNNPLMATALSLGKNAASAPIQHLLGSTKNTSPVAA